MKVRSKKNQTSSEKRLLDMVTIIENLCECIYKVYSLLILYVCTNDY